MYSDSWFFLDFVFYCVSTSGAQCILIWGNIVPPPCPLCMYGIQHHYCIGIVCIIAFPERSQSSFLFDETKVGFKSRCKKNFQQSTSPVVLKTRTFRLATKLRQKFNRFSPFRKLTSFVTSFTAYVIYAASPDTYNKIGEDNFISLKSFQDKKDWEIGQWRWKLMSGQKRGLGCITPSPSLQLLQIHSTKYVNEILSFIIFWG